MAEPKLLNILFCGPHNQCVGSGFGRPLYKKNLTEYVPFYQDLKQGSDSPEARLRFWTRKKGTESDERWPRADLLVSTADIATGVHAIQMMETDISAMK